MELLFDTEVRALIPPLQPDELAGLKHSLQRDGNRDAIVVWKEKQVILDGHNRYNICHELGLPLKTPHELSFSDRESAMIWVIENQFSRRNLSPYSRSVLALKRENLIKAKAKVNLITSTGGSNPQPLQNSAKAAIDTRQELAKIAHVSHDTIAKVKTIEAKATPEQKAKLVAGTATVNQVYVQLRREQVKADIKTAIFPDGKYRVIYADPPWEYGNTMPTGFWEQADHYPLMTVAEVCQLPVANLALDDAVLFLWVTSPILEESFQVIKAWGFEYKASFVWDKVKHVMGHYNSVRHEFLLVAVRGSCQPDNIELFDSVQSIERTEHSSKPEEFRHIIDTLYPYGPRIELFARKEVDGWERYGNQV